MGAHTGAMGGTKLLLLVFLVGWEKSMGLNWNPIPRKTVRYQGEWDVQSKESDSLQSQINTHFTSSKPVCPSTCCSFDSFYIPKHFSSYRRSLEFNPTQNIAAYLLSFFLPRPNELKLDLKRDLMDWRLLEESSKLPSELFICSEMWYKTSYCKNVFRFNDQWFSIESEVDAFRHRPPVKQYVGLIPALNCICTLYLRPPPQPSPTVFTEQCQLLLAKK